MHERNTHRPTTLDDCLALIRGAYSGAPRHPGRFSVHREFGEGVWKKIGEAESLEEAFAKLRDDIVSALSRKRRRGASFAEMFPDFGVSPGEELPPLDPGDEPRRQILLAMSPKDRALALWMLGYLGGFRGSMVFRHGADGVFPGLALERASRLVVGFMAPSPTLDDAACILEHPSGAFSPAEEALLRCVRASDGPGTARCLVAGTSPDFFTPEGLTPLHEAAANRDLATVDALLRAGADPRALDGVGFPVLLAKRRKDRAAPCATGVESKEHLAVLLRLLDGGADPSVTGADGRDFFTLLGKPKKGVPAVEQIRTRKLKLSRQGFLPHHPLFSDLSEQALSRALPAIELYLSAGADPELRAGFAEPTALHELLARRFSPIFTDARVGPVGPAFLALCRLLVRHGYRDALRIDGVDTIPRFPEHASGDPGVIGALRELLCSTHTEEMKHALAEGRAVEEARERAAEDADVGRALRNAIQKGDLGGAQRALARGADPRDVTHTPLHEAAGQDSVEIVKALLAAGADPAGSDQFGRTPLHLAALGEGPHAPEIVRVLLSAGTPVGRRSSTSGETALHIAAANESPVAPELVSALLDGGADANQASRIEEVALHRAARSLSEGRLPIVRALLARGADPNRATTTGETPLSRACFVAKTALGVEVVRALLEGGADPDRANNRGRTPLFGVVERASPVGKDLVRLLLDAGADPDHADDVGTTPMKCAARAAKAWLKRGG